MMTKAQYAEAVLNGAHRQPAGRESAEAFMPSNIALVKYWGKRAGELNLPLVSSLSRALGVYGTRTKISLSSADSVEMNGKTLDRADKSFTAIMAFLDLFRALGEHYAVTTSNNIPTAAGVASSASGYAALLGAMAALKEWKTGTREKSMLARLGSGSAARSFWPGLVHWRKGTRDDGMDCFAEPCVDTLSFGMAVLLLDTGEKQWSSRDAMKISLATSPLAGSWPAEQQKHLDAAFAALKARDFAALGAVAEENAVLLHRLIERSSPSIVFDKPATADWKQTVRKWRSEGLPLWFTQDAGANLKLLFPETARMEIEARLKNRGIDYLMV